MKTIRTIEIPVEFEGKVNFKGINDSHDQQEYFFKTKQTTQDDNAGGITDILELYAAHGNQEPQAIGKLVCWVVAPSQKFTHRLSFYYAESFVHFGISLRADQVTITKNKAIYTIYKECKFSVICSQTVDIDNKRMTLEVEMAGFTTRLIAFTLNIRTNTVHFSTEAELELEGMSLDPCDLIRELENRTIKF